MRPTKFQRGNERTPERSAAALAEPDLLAAGQQMLTPARHLLSRLDAPLLTVCRSAADPAEAVRLFAWTAGLEPSRALADEETDGWPELIPLKQAAAAALRQVSLRWPAYAVPPIVGLVTDGTGIAVSGEHPSGLTSEWLVEQLERPLPASVLIPFNPQGPWALLPGLSGALARRH